MQGVTMTEKNRTLYDPSFEHDACGIGAVVNIDGTATHKIVDNALCIVEKLEHRAGKDATGETGDGVGILVQISHRFFKQAAKQEGSARLRSRNVLLSAGQIYPLAGDENA